MAADDWKKQRLDLFLLPADVASLVVQYSPLTLWDVPLECEAIRNSLPSPCLYRKQGGDSRADSPKVLMSRVILQCLSLKIGGGVREAERSLDETRREWDAMHNPFRPSRSSTEEDRNLFYSFCACLSTVHLDPTRWARYLHAEDRMWCFLELVLRRSTLKHPIAMFFVCLQDIENCQSVKECKEIETLNLVALLNTSIEKSLEGLVSAPGNKWWCRGALGPYSELRLLTQENRQKMRSWLDWYGFPLGAVRPPKEN